MHEPGAMGVLVSPATWPSPFRITALLHIDGNDRAPGPARSSRQLRGGSAADLVVDQTRPSAVGWARRSASAQAGSPSDAISRRNSQRGRIVVAVRIGTLTADDHNLIRSAIVVEKVRAGECRCRCRERCHRSGRV